MKKTLIAVWCSTVLLVSVTAQNAMAYSYVKNCGFQYGCCKSSSGSTKWVANMSGNAQCYSMSGSNSSGCSATTPIYGGDSSSNHYFPNTLTTNTSSTCYLV